jgi:hypothetical protein
MQEAKSSSVLTEQARSASVETVGAAPCVLLKTRVTWRRMLRWCWPHPHQPTVQQTLSMGAARHRAVIAHNSRALLLVVLLQSVGILIQSVSMYAYAPILKAICYRPYTYVQGSLLLNSHA